MQDEPWAQALHLRELYVQRIEAILADLTADDVAAMRVAIGETLALDPDGSLTRVNIQVQAIFGELDVNVAVAAAQRGTASTSPRRATTRSRSSCCPTSGTTSTFRRQATATCSADWLRGRLGIRP